MTDKQIIAMLERNADYDCLECDYYKTVWCEGEGCNVKIAKLALGLIKRQQAEIEDKQKHLELWVKKFYAKKSNVERLEMEKSTVRKRYIKCSL